MLGDDVDCYNVAHITIDMHAVVSQYSFLCTASHDYRCRDNPLISAPIYVEKHAWVASDVFIAPGVVVGEGAVVQARSVVLKDVEKWTVVGGHPAKKIKTRLRPM